MVYLEEQRFFLFMGSPNIRNVKDLTGSGTFISDIPIHDAMRDVILIGEQAKAQESLKHRMDKLRWKFKMYITLQYYYQRIIYKTNRKKEADARNIGVRAMVERRITKYLHFMNVLF